MQSPNDRDLALERALCDAGRHLERDSNGWRLVVANGALTTLRAQVIDEDWLAVTAPCVSPPASWWPLLRRNAGLGGCARLARTRSGNLEVRAEIFVGSGAEGADFHDVSLGERVAALCDEVLTAAHNVFDTVPNDVAATTPGSLADADLLVRLCGDVGWTATTRASGEVHVPLDTRVAAFEAKLSLENGSRLRAIVPLAAAPMAPGASQDAIALLLLDAGAYIRTVKGLAVRHDNVEHAGLAFAGESLPASPSTIDRALGALSVACSTVGREVQALQDEQLARDYLALRDLCWNKSRSPVPYSPEQENTPCLQLP